jgi:hypothetical protein
MKGLAVDQGRRGGDTARREGNNPHACQLGGRIFGLMLRAF